MKKFIILLLMLVPFVSGCTNITTNLTINNDKTASIENILTYNGNLNNKKDLIALTINENYKKFLDSHYLVDRVIEKDNSKIIAKKHVKNLYYTDLEFTSLGFKTNLPNNRFILVKKNFFVTSYNIDMTYNLPLAENKVELIRSLDQAKKSKNIITQEYLAKYGEKQRELKDDTGREDIKANLDSSTYLLAKETNKDNQRNNTPINKNVKYDIKDLGANFTITLPSFASYNNADNNIGTIYVWKIRKDSPTNIKLQYVVYSNFAVIFLIMTGVLILLYLSARMLRHDSLKGVNRTKTEDKSDII